ncbi:hypothetical protein GCM10012275_36440 [Longimycelium tulufanense]|uniref:Peptidase S33 tripeptidyl aminopeptidase-like C-terminal domain-containing protein n=1 Tax=Longimycelium tulufanense TaxID=907463 RepID=A0A8J3FUV3_9PSEU|nr:alpha/beta hydrolase [Longimycelium tulufanense]GGM62454.1 hypothetical protein GCM10012275_36440 [Longimycelium tulufanense]
MSWWYPLSACASWPVRDPLRYDGLWHRPTSAPILLANNRFDPATPVKGARRAHQRLANSRYVKVVNGYGHVPIDDCFSRVNRNDLVDRRLPSADVRCDDGLAPFSG